MNKVVIALAGLLALLVTVAGLVIVYQGEYCIAGSVLIFYGGVCAGRI